MKSDYHIASDIRKNKNTLMHHGIDGQKWGVKHGPPYPLGSKVSTGSSLKKGARAKTIAKAALEGAALGAVAGGVVGGPVGAGLSSIASAGASAIATAISTRKNAKSRQARVLEKAEKYAKKNEEKIMKQAGDTWDYVLEKYKDPEFRKNKYEDAKNNDNWDYAFLEAYDLNNRNENFKWDDAKALKEYEKYLNDPKEWLRSNSSSYDKTFKKIENSTKSATKPRLDVHEKDVFYENNNPTKEDKNLARLVTSEGYGKYILDEAAEANDHNWPAFEKYTENNSAFIDTRNKNSSLTFKSERSEIKNDKKSGAVEGKVYTVDSVKVPVFNDGNYDLDRSCRFTREYYDAYDGEYLGSKKVNISSSKK